MSTLPRSAAVGLRPPEMAFVRAWAEGLDLLRAWQQYLQQGDAAPALHVARAALQALLGRLRSQARSQGRPELANLLQRDPEAVLARASEQPTLDEFRAQQPPDFYSEAELVALYQAEHRSSKTGDASRRRQRLRARLVAALHTLDGLAAQPPQAADAVHNWLDEGLARRLGSVGIRSLADLQTWIASHGLRWHRRIPGLGGVGAARVVAWLHSHQASLGTPASDAPGPGSAIVPLERLELPYSGAQTLGHSGDPQAGAELAAVKAWLALRPTGSATWRAYRKAAERWLLWTLVERRQTLSTLNASDCQLFTKFLAQPGKSWTAARSTRRSQAAWRPFEAGLAPRSVAMTVSVVRALCAWLVTQGHLAANPWDLQPPAVLPASAGLGAMPNTAGQHHAARAEATADSAVVPGRQAGAAGTSGAVGAAPTLRALSAEHWRRLQSWAAALPPSLTNLRVRCLLALAGGTGMRLSELAKAKIGWLCDANGQAGLLSGDADSGMGLLIHGKQGKTRWVPLPAAGQSALISYLLARDGRMQLGHEQAQQPLLTCLNKPSSLSACRLYEVVHEALVAAALDTARDDAAAAASLRRASTHWLRHSFALRCAAEGLGATALQALLGHERPGTTLVYRRAAAQASAGHGG